MDACPAWHLSPAQASVANNAKAFRNRRFQRLIAVIAVLAANLSAQSASAQTNSQNSTQVIDVSRLSFRVGRAMKHLGSGTIINGQLVAADGPFVGYNTGTAIRGYFGAGVSYTMTGTSLEQMTLNPVPVMNAGTSGFDRCGAWMMAAIPHPADTSVIRGWYHGESRYGASDCLYGTTEPHYKSIGGSAAVYNYGTSFGSRIQIITAPPADTQGEGDFSVIKTADAYYMYISRPSSATTRVARIPVFNYWYPGSFEPWLKWLNGAFSEPGLGGESTPLQLYRIGEELPNSPLYRQPVFLGTSASQFTGLTGIANGGLGVALVGWEGSNFAVTPNGTSDYPFDPDPHRINGIRLAVAETVVGDFTEIPEPLLYVPQHNPNREDTSVFRGEILTYPSVIAPGAAATWSKATGQNPISFYLFYTYIPPEQAVSETSSVRRTVEVFDNMGVVSPQVRVALSRYFSSSTLDHWETTALVPDDHAFEFTLGYIFTKNRPGMKKLYECGIPSGGGRVDHMLADYNCFYWGIPTLRMLGWVYETAQQGTVPLNRCYWPNGDDHYSIVNSTDCGGDGAYFEYTLGYIAAQ